MAAPKLARVRIAVPPAANPRTPLPVLLRATTLSAFLTVVLLAAPARALIAPPVTLEDRGAGVIELGGVAIAADGSGGLVYTKLVAGVPHLFARRYVQSRWSAPIRVDGDRPYDASSPRVAADEGGRLLVVWVTQMATVHDRVQRGLVSATLARGARTFSPSVVIDPDVGDGAGVTPALSRTAPGQATVAYRVVTDDFTDVGSIGTAVQLRPGDVMADVRVARLRGPGWARLGAVNRNPLASQRAPVPATAPQVGAGPDGNAVVAWQEPDQSGTARIWLRRIFGTVPGPAIEASPITWQGAPVNDDADAFALDVTDFEQARVAMRLSSAAGGGARLFLTTLPTSLDDNAARAQSPVLVEDDPGPQSGIGVPSVSISDEGGSDGGMWLGYPSGDGVRFAALDDDGTLAPRPALGAHPVPGAEVVTAIDPAGGGVAAWSARDDGGRDGIGVRQDFPGGAVQTALVASDHGGPVARLSIGRAPSGDAIVAFQQGGPGRVEIVADRVTVPPAAFPLDVPADWVRPSRIRISWDAAPSAVGGVTYSVLLDGRVVAHGLTRRTLRPSAHVLGNGKRSVQVLATDALGQQLLGPALTLRVDARGPRPQVVRTRARERRARRAARTRGTGHAITVQVRDPESGVAAGATRCSFGDGTRTVRGGRSCRHVYAHAGRYRIVVRSRDKVGNRIARTLPVTVG